MKKIYIIMILVNEHFASDHFSRDFGKPRLPAGRQGGTKDMEEHGELLKWIYI